MTSSAGSFACNALHSATITKEAVCVIAKEIIAWLVEDGSSMRLSNCKTDRIGESLTKRASCDFNTVGIVAFRMTRCDAINTL
jgi:hypothetical protein